MNTKRTDTIALLCAATLLFTAQAFAQGFPAYFKMDGTKITGCDIDDIPDNLVIPEGVTEIGEDAFGDCMSLKSVIIPESVTEIGGGAFIGCESLASVTIPDSVTKIGEYAFAGCYSLKSVTIPASVKNIEEGAFMDCKNMTVRYNGTLAQWCEMDNDTFLVPYAKKIAMSDVANLKAVTALAIPEGVKKIGYFAFEDCKSLKRVSVPSSVTEVGGSAFNGCTSLKSVTIPDSVTKIRYSAFKNCRSLKKVTIPASVTELCRWAFQDCESLREMKFLGTKAQWNSIVKGDDWNLNIPANKVVCADGEADLY